MNSKPLSEMNPRELREHENALADWCNEQRVLKQKGLLEDDKIKKLEEVPYWTWTVDKEYLIRMDKEAKKGKSSCKVCNKHK